MPSDKDFVELQAENDLLRGRIDQLERALFAKTSIPVEWGLTPTEARVVACLLTRPNATKDALMAALYRDQGKDEPEQKIVDVLVCKIRKKLKPFNVEIKTIWGQGYFIDEAERRRISGENSAVAA